MTSTEIKKEVPKTIHVYTIMSELQQHAVPPPSSPRRMKIIVADSGAFIKGAPLENWSSKVVTVKEVVEEIRDEATRRRLQVLPYELSFNTPTFSALQQVTSFAKKTGDYGSLSSVDLKIMALTYQLSCELEPEKSAELRRRPAREEASFERVTLPGMVGVYNKSCQKLDSTDFVSETFKTLSVETTPSNVVECSPSRSGESELKHCHHSSVRAVVEDETHSSDTMSCPDDEHSDSRPDWSGDDDDDDDDDGEGWINPDNFKAACAEMGGAVEEEPVGVAVGCVTTDFAMQNVLLQMGLAVISVDGLRIKQLRMYAKKCKACFKTTTNTGLRFCPKCGNRTLAKVSVTVGKDGKLHYHFLSDKQFSHKGLRHSIPLPKGGRHANNPVLAPDQRVTYRQKRSRKGNVHPLHPDYIAQSSPFSMTDVTSRGAQISFQGGGRGGRRRNPNAVRPKSKRK